MDKEKAIGEKIRFFRKRAGMSQLELEVAIGGANGGISRIENGQVNPTKETLLKISEVLHLSSFEVASLFDIEMTNIPQLLRISKEVYDSKSLGELLQKAVDTIVYELSLVGSFIALKDGHKLKSVTTTKTWYTELAMKIIGQRVTDLSVDLEKDLDNLMVKTVLEKTVYTSLDISDFIVPAVNASVSRALIKLSQTKSGIALPMISKGETIGAIFFSKAFDDRFQVERPILEAFTEYVTDAIVRFKPFHT